MADIWKDGGPDRGIYPDDLAERLKEQAGEKYRPSNGTEGRIFMSRWCNDCVKDSAYRADPSSGEGCPIIAAALTVSKEDENYPVEWQYGEDGQPRCTAFEAHNE